MKIEDIIQQMIATAIVVAPMLVAFRVSMEHRITKLEVTMTLLMDAHKLKHEDTRP